MWFTILKLFTELDLLFSQGLGFTLLNVVYETKQQSTYHVINEDRHQLYLKLKKEINVYMNVIFTHELCLTFNFMLCLHFRGSAK